MVDLDKMIQTFEGMRIELINNQYIITQQTQCIIYIYESYNQLIYAVRRYSKMKHYHNLNQYIKTIWSEQNKYENLRYKT